MRETLENPLITQLEESMMEGYGNFPDKVFLIGMGDNKYACNNATLTDGQSVDGLAAFPDPDEATTYMSLLAGLSGEIVAKRFQEAREIAISKPRLMCIFLFVGGKIVDVHWVR